MWAHASARASTSVVRSRTASHICTTMPGSVTGRKVTRSVDIACAEPSYIAVHDGGPEPSSSTDVCRSRNGIPVPGSNPESAQARSTVAAKAGFCSGGIRRSGRSARSASARSGLEASGWRVGIATTIRSTHAGMRFRSWSFLGRRTSAASSAPERTASSCSHTCPISSVTSRSGKCVPRWSSSRSTRLPDPPAIPNRRCGGASDSSERDRTAAAACDTASSTARASGTSLHPAAVSATWRLDLSNSG